MSTDGLLNVYLAVGTDLLKRQRVIDRLRARLEKLGDISFNSDVFTGETATGTEIVSACNTLPFASEVRLVEIRNVDKLSKSASEALVSYLVSPCESTILLLSGDKLAKNTRLYKAIAALGKNTIIDCAPMKRQELASSLRSMAVAHGFTMTIGACERLIDLVGEDTIRLDTELKKLAIAHNGNDPVTDSEVSSLVAQTSEVKPWDLVDAFAARNIAKCFHLLPRLSKTSPFYLLSLCQTCLRDLLSAKSYERQGRGQELVSGLGFHPRKAQNYLRWSRGFTDEELVHALIASRNVEMQMKSGADQRKTLEDWICNSIARKIQ